MDNAIQQININNLPTELLEHIFIEFNVGWHQIIMSVCRRWYTILLNWRKWELKLPKPKKLKS